MCSPQVLSQVNAAATVRTLLLYNGMVDWIALQQEQASQTCLKPKPLLQVTASAEQINVGNSRQALYRLLHPYLRHLASVEQLVNAMHYCMAL